jgi:hypothetical protein
VATALKEIAASIEYNRKRKRGDRAAAFRHSVLGLLGLFVEEEMIIAEVGARHMPNGKF